MSTTEKAQFLISIFGKTWLQSKLGTSATTLRNRIEESFPWREDEVALIDRIYNSPVKEL